MVEIFKLVLKELFEHVRLYKVKSSSYASQITVQPETVIGNGIKLKGTIFSETKLIIEGEIEGNIECNNMVIVKGKVIGDIRCESAEIDNGCIEGNIDVSSKVIIKEGGKIIGQVRGGYVEVSGKVKGDIIAKKSIILHSNAYVFGDAEALIVSIGTGAYVEGTVII